MVVDRRRWQGLLSISGLQERRDRGRRRGKVKATLLVEEVEDEEKCVCEERNGA